ncbi:MAG: TetR/AcrR family transcriptional regulator C-terminal domain-containing protein [Ilumatobacteraceae bacterium]
MTPPTATDTDETRAPLTADRVLQGALDLADRIGVEAFTIRKLATELDSKPMTIYHHVPSKEAIIDGIVDMVFAEIELPPADLPWLDAIRARCISAREVLAHHPWAPPLMESRTNPGPATLRHQDAVLGCFRRGGLSLPMTAHAYAIVDSFVYGFAMQEANLPFHGDEEIASLADDIIASLPADELPHLTEFTADHVLRPGYTFGASFEFGLDLLLDGIESAAG